MEALRSQLQEQSAEINQLKAERQDLLLRAETGVNIITVTKISQLFLTAPYKLLLGCLQPFDTVSTSDSSSDSAKMADLENRLAAHTAETEKLKVCRAPVLHVCYSNRPWLSPFLPSTYCTLTCYCAFPVVYTSSILSLLVQDETKRLSESRADLEQQLASATSTVAILQTENAKLQTEVQESKKEQDDLLMLLADQDQKIHSLKQRLKSLGQTVDALYPRLYLAQP